MRFRSSAFDRVSDLFPAYRVVQKPTAGQVQKVHLG
jgi:hypothetical protein